MASRGAPPGAIVRLAPYDWQEPESEPPPASGDYVVSSGGSAYAILDARETRRPRRYVLTCVKLASEEDVPPEARRLGLHWYPRGRRRDGRG